MIIEVDEQTVTAAAEIHAEAWRKSHRAFCSEEFVAKHTVSRQREYLEKEMAAGKRLYMLVEDRPLGIVSVDGDLIENLYVLPSEQRKGCGTRLLLFALTKCAGNPRLWILDNNEGAYALYTAHGFAPTGNRHILSPTLSEIELRLERQ